MEYSYKFRIYPNTKQENQIVRTFGCCRYVYNYYLNKRKEMYESVGVTLNYYKCANDLTGLKRQPGTEWLQEVDATALQSSIRSLDTAFQNFFRRVRVGEKPGYPHFKSKRNHSQSYQSKCVGTNIKVLNGKVQLPKLGLVKCKISKLVKGRILSATVSRNPSGKYFVSINCTDVEIEPLPSTGNSVGIDLGINKLATTSGGIKYSNPKSLENSLVKVARFQKSLSRKTKGSNNYEKARIRLARAYERVTDQRNDYLHKMSTSLIRENDIICIEELKTRELLQKGRFSRLISDASWGEFRRQLKYKAAWYGRKVIEIDQYYPSSQICSCCGYQNPSVKDLKVRTWICPECHTKHDRDINAAKNILAEGLRSI